MHNPWTGLLGGALTGTLPNPGLEVAEAGMAIASQVFGRFVRPWTPSDDIAARVFEPHRQHVPEIQAGTNITIVRNALGHVISSSGGGGGLSLGQAIAAVSVRA